MAGQGIQRREMLRVIGVAAVASHFPGFVKWAYAQAHEHASDEPAAGRPKAYTPQFFSREDFACVERLTDLIIPTDGTPGAREVGVAEFVDFMVAHDTQQQQPMRAGLAWLQEQSGRRFAQPFLELSEAQQVSLLEPLAYEPKYREGEEVGREPNVHNYVSSQHSVVCLRASRSATGEWSSLPSRDGRPSSQASS